MTIEAPKIEQLPRGRHRLSREEVLSSQRGRMLVGIGVAVAEKGYARASVADVIRTAGVSRETFYEHFANKEACFLAAFDVAADVLIAAVEEALGDAGDPPLERIDRAVGAYLETMAAEPTFGRGFLVEIYGAGPAAVERRSAFQRRFATTVGAVLGAKGKDDRFACEALVAAAAMMVTAELGAGRPGDLKKLRAPFMRLVSRTFPDA